MMVRKILKMLTNNIGLKLISILLAFILWLVVVNIDNPKTTVTFTAVATIENPSVITDNGKVYEILDDSNMVTFTVTGQRTVVEGLSASDFSVIADMNKIDLDLGFVPIDVTPLRYASQIVVEKKTTNLKVIIEELATEQFAISANASGKPADNFAEGSLVANPATVTVAGPESVIRRIGKVVATINIDDAYSDRKQSVVPVIYDGDGKIIDTTNLSVSPGTVEVTSEILETKEIPITVEVSGKAADGYTYLEARCAPDAIVIKGKKKELRKISSILIPKEDISIDGAKKDIEKMIDIRKYLPEGVEVYDQDLANVAVTVTIKALTQKTIVIPLEEIEILNLAEGYEVQFEEGTVKANLEGMAEMVSHLQISDLDPYIDLKNYSEGTFEVEVTLNLSEGVIQKEMVKIKGKIVPKEEDEPEPPDMAGSTD